MHALVNRLEEEVVVDGITRVSWSLGDMVISVWRMKGAGLLWLIATLLRDENIEM